jgi:hypothetical protein
MSGLEIKGLLTRGRAMVASVALGTAVVFTPASMVAAQTTVGDGLVNVAVGDVNVLNDANIGVAAQVAAQICGVKVGPVALLATTVDRSGADRVVCRSNQQPVTISQN